MRYRVSQRRRPLRLAGCKKPWKQRKFQACLRTYLDGLVATVEDGRRRQGETRGHRVSEGGRMGKQEGLPQGKQPKSLCSDTICRETGWHQAPGGLQGDLEGLAGHAGSGAGGARSHGGAGLDAGTHCPAGAAHGQGHFLFLVEWLLSSCEAKLICVPLCCDRVFSFLTNEVLSSKGR